MNKKIIKLSLLPLISSLASCVTFPEQNYEIYPDEDNKCIDINGTSKNTTVQTTTDLIFETIDESKNGKYLLDQKLLHAYLNIVKG